MKKLTDRLQLLNGGRDIYLDYLRNLTPQILLLTAIWLASAKFEPHLDFSNFWPTFAFFTLISCFFLAAYANTTRLYERCFIEWETWRKEQVELLTTQGLKGPRRYLAAIKAVMKYKLIETIELVFIMFVFQITLAVVLGMSLTSANNIWLNNHKASNQVSKATKEVEK